jgi:uncharacterized protein (TIGR00296 family)
MGDPARLGTIEAAGVDLLEVTGAGDRKGKARVTEAWDVERLVQDMAVSASNDGRFDRLKPKELENMELEISVLSPLKKIDSVNEIELGKHGVYIKKGINSGTFLPQVATKTEWNLEEFLGHCSRDKAGIGWDGWKTADIFTYEAIVFR